MVVTTRVLTSPSSCVRTTPEELQSQQDASLVLPSEPEPLNGTTHTDSAGLSFSGIGEGKLDSETGETAIGRIPVVSADGTPLMPCKPAKARKLLRDGKAIKKRSELH